MRAKHEPRTMVHMFYVVMVQAEQPQVLQYARVAATRHASPALPAFSTPQNAFARWQR